MLVVQNVDTESDHSGYRPYQVYRERALKGINEATNRQNVKHVKQQPPTFELIKEKNRGRHEV